MWVRCSLCLCLDASFQFVNRQSAFADNLDGRALRALCVRIRFRFFKNCSSSSSKAFNFYILRMQWGKSLLEKQMFRVFSCTNFFLKYDVKLYFIFRLHKNCSGRQGGSITVSIQKQSDCNFAVHFGFCSKSPFYLIMKNDFSQNLPLTVMCKSFILPRLCLFSQQRSEPLLITWQNFLFSFTM